MTILLIVLLVALVALVVCVLLPVILLHEWPIWRRACDYSPYQRNIDLHLQGGHGHVSVTHTEGFEVDLTGVKPTGKKVA